MKKFIRELLIFDRSAFAARDASRCVLAVAVALGVGIFVHHPLGGMVMASGAMSVGFGSFQRLYRSRVSPMALAFFVVAFAWLSYVLQKVNYVLYSICITSYVVFLLSFAGLPGKTVVYYRVLNTAIGGVIALLAYGSLLFKPSRRIPLANAAFDIP